MVWPFKRKDKFNDEFHPVTGDLDRLGEIKGLINSSFTSANKINNKIIKIEKSSKKFKVIQKNYVKKLVRLGGFIFAYYADMKGRKYKRLLTLDVIAVGQSMTMSKYNWDKLADKVGKELQKLIYDIKMILKYEEEMKKVIEENTKIFPGEKEDAKVIKKLAELYIDLKNINEGSVALMNVVSSYYKKNWDRAAL